MIEVKQNKHGHPALSGTTTKYFSGLCGVPTHAAVTGYHVGGCSPAGKSRSHSAREIGQFPMSPNKFTLDLLGVAFLGLRQVPRCAID